MAGSSTLAEVFEGEDHGNAEDKQHIGCQGHQEDGDDDQSEYSDASTKQNEVEKDYEVDKGIVCVNQAHFLRKDQLEPDTGSCPVYERERTAPI